MSEPRTWMLCNIRGEWTLSPPEGITAAEVVFVVELLPVLSVLERLVRKPTGDVVREYEAWSEAAAEADVLLRAHGRLGASR